jgi:5-methylcytosine-specific restriction endonuclease McrA
LFEFHKNKAKRDGLMTICKPCNIAHVLEWQANNPEKLKARHAQWEHDHASRSAANKRKWQQANPEQAKAIQQRRWQKDREKVLARSAISNAVRLGQIAPADSYFCFVCGNPATEFHHVDYSKPLEVIPMCASCHKRWHAGNG